MMTDTQDSEKLMGWRFVIEQLRRDATEIAGRFDYMPDAPKRLTDRNNNVAENMRKAASLLEQNGPIDLAKD